MLLRCLLGVFAVGVCSALGADESKFTVQEIETGLNVGYAVSLCDVNGDERLDIVVVDSRRVVWYDNPTWRRRTIIEEQTKADNVCIAPHDIDGDGQLDFALGADWRPADTVASGSIQWLRRGASLDEKWEVLPIGVEPTTHRMRWVDLDQNGRSELIVVPLFGRGASAPKYEERPVRILSYSIPADPARDAWTPEVISEQLHVAHNFCTADLDADGQGELVVASFEGLTSLTKTPDGSWRHQPLGAGNQATSPSRGSSEVKHGRLADGGDYLATIEPWHGFQVVVYTRPSDDSDDALWRRQVLDEELQWGHAIWCANLDSDPDEELIAGVRDRKEGAPSGVRIYAPSAGGEEWTRRLLDPDGVAVEDLAAADLDGNGLIDIVASGRASKNVRIYWNGAAPPGAE